MLQNIRVESEKALQNTMFIGALVIGSLLSLVNVFDNVETVRSFSATLHELIRGGWAISHSYEGFSLFVSWIAVNPLSFGHNLFYFIWPILAAMPYGWSYCSERRSGYYNQVVSRNNAKAYFIGKYIAVFISGGLVISIPVLFDLLINALICPTCIPDVTMSLLPINNSSLLGSLFYTNPWMYAFLWCVIHYFWGGVTACLCFLAGSKIRLQVVVTLVPFVIYILVDAISTTFCYVTQSSQGFSPLNLINAVSLTSNPGWVVFSVMGLILIVTFVFGYMQVVRHELD